MKLARIDHWRCGEYDEKYTFVWVADDMVADELDALAIEAKLAHIAAAREAKTADMASPGYQPNYKLYPNKTVAEIDAEHEKRVAAWKLEVAKRQQAEKSFTDLLVEVGKGRIKYFDTPEMVSLRVEAHWGHCHGIGLDYGATEVDEQDMPGSAARPGAI